MTCQWDRTWSPSNKLHPCQWVACLKPTAPPPSTNLRINDWDGKPIAFGDLAHYVCDRGMMFEEDMEQLEVTYACQDGTDKAFKKGFFNTPKEEREWPRCVQGPLCPQPPEVPEEGTLLSHPIVFQQPTVSTCAIDGKTVDLKCHSFLSVYIPSATFGRDFNETSKFGKVLCDGAEPADSEGAQGAECRESSVGLLAAQVACHGRPSCSVAVTPSLATLPATCSTLRKELRTEHICG